MLILAEQIATQTVYAATSVTGLAISNDLAALICNCKED